MKNNHEETKTTKVSPVLLRLLRFFVVVFLRSLHVVTNDALKQ